MSAEVIAKLEKENWQFKRGYAMPVTEFKSPRLKGFYLFVSEDFTEEEIKQFEIECFLSQRASDFERLCNEANKKYIRELKLVLKKNGEISNEITIDLKFL